MTLIRSFYSMSKQKRTYAAMFCAMLVGFVCGLTNHTDFLLIVFACTPIVLVALYPEIVAIYASIAARGKNTALARSICAHGLSLSPKNSALHHAQAISFYFDKRFAEAENEATAALELEPEATNVLITRSAIRISLLDYEGALEDTNKSLQINPGQLLSQQNRVATRVSMQRYDEAIADILDLQKRGRDTDIVRLMLSQCYLLTGRIAEAEALFSRLIGSARPGSADALAIAQCHYTRNQFAEVLTATAQHPATEPLASAFLNLQAFAYWRLSEGQLALSSAARSIEVNPTHENGYALRVYVFSAAGRFDQALAALQAEPVVRSRSSVAREARAFYFWQRKDWDQMLQASDEAIEKHNKSAYAWSLQSIALTGLGRIDEALESAQKALKITPMEPRAWYSLANAHLKNGDAPEAIKFLNKALEVCPDDRPSYQLRAEAYAATADDARATQDRIRFEELQQQLVAHLPLALPQET